MNEALIAETVSITGHDGDEIEAYLARPLGVDVYDGAGHAFFSVNRPAYRVEAANDGWQKIWDFYGRYLAG
jgi:carboxymethylenebutenolidase